MKHILFYQNNPDISMMTAFCEQAAHFLGINLVQQIVEDYSRVCKIFWYTFEKLYTSSDVERWDCVLLTVAP